MENNRDDYTRQTQRHRVTAVYRFSGIFWWKLNRARLSTLRRYRTRGLNGVCIARKYNMIPYTKVGYI